MQGFFHALFLLLELTERKQQRSENETLVLFHFPLKIMQSKQRQIWRRTKIKRTFSSVGKRPATQIQVVTGKPRWPGGESCAQG